MSLSSRIASYSYYNYAETSSITLENSFNLQVGDILVWSLGCRDGLSAPTITIQDNNAQNTGSSYGQTVYGTDTFLDAGYIIVTTANATALMTVNLSVAQNRGSFVVSQFRPDAGETITPVTLQGAYGTSALMQSGNISPSGDDILVVACGFNRAGPATAAETIGGASAETYTRIGCGGQWETRYTSSQTSIYATATFGDNDAWVCAIFALVSSAPTYLFHLNAELNDLSEFDTVTGSGIFRAQNTVVLNDQYSFEFLSSADSITVHKNISGSLTEVYIGCLLEIPTGLTINQYISQSFIRLNTTGSANPIMIGYRRYASGAGEPDMWYSPITGADNTNFVTGSKVWCQAHFIINGTSSGFEFKVNNSTVFSNFSQDWSTEGTFTTLELGDRNGENDGTQYFIDSIIADDASEVTMPIVTKYVTVAPSGGDYSSLSSAITGEISSNDDLITHLINRLRFHIIGTWSSPDTTRVTVDGFTTDSTHYVVIDTDSANKFDGVYDSGKYRLEATSGSLGTLTIQSGYTKVIGLQVRDTTGAGYAAIQCPSGPNHVLDSCLAHDSGWYGFYISGSASNVVLINCISMRNVRPGFVFSTSEASATHRVYNCASISAQTTYYGFDVNSNVTLYGVNCYAGNNGGNDWNGTGTYNLTDCYSEDGTQSTTVATFNTSNFTNVTSGSEDLTLVSGSDLIDVGTDLSGDSTYPFNWDAAGNTRTGTWDIGPLEFITGGGTTYTVTYDDNGSTSGSVPVDGNSPYDEGTQVTVLGNTGLLFLDGYVFNGWNTAANGSGTPYDPADTFNIYANTILYAQWLEITSTRIINHTNFDADDLTATQVTNASSLKVYFEHASTGQDIVGDSDADSSTGLASTTGNCGLALLYALNNRYLCNRESYSDTNDPTWFSTNNGLQDNNRGNPTPATKLSGFLTNAATMDGYADVVSFKFCWIDVWNGSPDGPTSGYISNGASFAASMISDIETFEASYPSLTFFYWTLPLQVNPEDYVQRIIFNEYIRKYCQENNKYLLDIADLESHNDAGTLQLDSNGRPVLNASYAYDEGHLSNPDGRVKLAKAYWSLLSVIYEDTTGTTTYTITYDGNTSTSGTVPVDSNFYTSSDPVSILNNTGNLLKTGYIFRGWSTTNNGSGYAYYPGQIIYISQNTTLYARWADTLEYINTDILDNGLTSLEANGDTFVMCDTYPTSYTEASSTYMLTTNSITISSPSSYSGTGRRVTTSSITGGVFTSDGTATYWAILDSVGESILAIGRFRQAQAVVIDDTFNLGPIEIGIL